MCGYSSHLGCLLTPQCAAPRRDGSPAHPYSSNLLKLEAITLPDVTPLISKDAVKISDLHDMTPIQVAAQLLGCSPADLDDVRWVVGDMKLGTTKDLDSMAVKAHLQIQIAGYVIQARVTEQMFQLVEVAQGAVEDLRGVIKTATNPKDFDSAMRSFASLMNSLSGLYRATTSKSIIPSSDGTSSGKKKSLAQIVKEMNKEIAGK